MADPHRFTLEELLRQDWEKELLRFPCEDSEGPLHAAVEGNAFPAQCWVDPAGKNHACFIADLPALGKRTFTVAPGPAAQDTDLTIEEETHCVRLRTSRFGVDVPLGTFSGDHVPAPIRGMTWSDGTSFGGGRWFGEAPVKLESELTATGPVLAEINMSWTWSDGATGTLRLELAAGDCQALWESWSSADRNDRGWDLSIRGLGPLILHGIGGEKWKNTWGIERGKSGDVTLDDKWTGMLTCLSPWRDWWDDQAQISWTFKTAERGFVLQARPRDVGDWVEPDPPGTFASWDKRIHKFLPMHRGDDGDIFLHVDQAAGWRKWTFGAAGKPVGRHLNEIHNDMVLDWPDDRQHPFLFLSADDIAAKKRPLDDPEVQELLTHADEDLDTPYKYGVGPGNDHLQNAGDDKAISAWLLTNSDEVAERVHIVERLRGRLDWLGDFDLMRYVTKIALFYDLVIDSGLVTPEERRVFKAQMAYLGYKLANPGTWSMERGYRSGPPNMSISYVLNLGTVACAICNHPAAKEWAAYATARYRQWMVEKAGPHGEWPESMHYIHVSTNDFMTYAIASRNAGFADLLAEGLLKRVMLYAAKLHAPPDPRGNEIDGPITDHSCRRANVRGVTPLGRAGSTGTSFGHYGVLAKATAESDPAFSRIMQWLYRESGWCECYGNESLDAIRLVYPDRSLPAESPDWHSELLSTGLFIRDRVGQPDEDHLVFEGGALFTTPGEKGGMMLWFWKGVPIVSRFSGGYDERAEALISGVSRAIPRTPEDPTSWCDTGEQRALEFARLDSAEYALLEGERGPAYGQLHAYPPGFPEWPDYENPAKPDDIMHWRRQILYVKDEDEGSFLLLRDSVAGNNATWKLWTLSTDVAATDDRAMFSATGQFGVDLDCFIAAPADTPRHTLRYERKYSYVKKLLQGFVDAQDLLQVEVPDGQSCFAALVPRYHDDAPPAIETFADGRVIRLKRETATFYAVLADQDADVQDETVRCTGPTGLVRQTDDATTLSILSGGHLRFADYGVRSTEATDVEITADRVTVRVPYRKASTRVIDLCLPGDWELRSSSTSFLDPKLIANDGFYRLQIIPEVYQAVTIHRRG
ncbi:MAG: hypothetical protein K9N51_00060 [Candidatus Pacebacteria bacterium]|nr:hypothetical protein [Candidatus Paceibacterota bacterium]